MIPYSVSEQGLLEESQPPAVLAGKETTKLQQLSKVKQSKKIVVKGLFSNDTVVQGDYYPYSLIIECQKKTM